MKLTIMATMYTNVIFFSLLLLSEVVSAQTDLHITQPLRDPYTLVSSNVIFKLGFFSPTNSTNRYVGVWYNVSDSDGKLEVVWVANRENPVSDLSGVLKLSEDGNLQVVDGRKTILWSSNVPAYNANNSVVQLLDDGNLVLNSGGMIIWQSFDHPTDTFLPGMRFIIDSNVIEKQVLFRPWKSPSDPSPGEITTGLTTRFPPELFIWDDDHPYYRTEPWNGNLLNVMQSAVLSVVTDDRGIIYYGFSEANQSRLLHIVGAYDGDSFLRNWDGVNGKWENLWNSRQSECDLYNKCGPFGSCKATNSPICNCLTGFVPKNQTEWNKGNWIDGCVRRTSLQCDPNVAKTDVFWNMAYVKVPDNAVWATGNSVDDCKMQCLSNCSCVAYSHSFSIGCMTWYGNLIDVVETSNSRGLNFYARLARSELEQKVPGAIAKKSGRWKVIVMAMAITIGTAIFGICMWLYRRQGMRLSATVNNHNKDIEIGDLPMLELEKLIAATNNFHNGNKLGRGGFGTVYKGNLEDGEDVAVKRLSKVSGQGLKEFMTEVLVISKLQHRNLVRLLGCCVEGEEKLLVYEFLPNGSLDALIFGRHHGGLSNWKTRFNIIHGICRGLLYLHRDSRLKIIHRDLKASNILLDDKLNPKISDFGMAKIFEGNEDQADTKTVVGTYGYMSPEYAMEGRFSEKSDIFSLGVLFLEIVSGRRNSSFKDEEALSLLAHAWKLWNEDNIGSLIYDAISESTFNTDEILRCIQVALLCVQEVPEDRPNIAMIISMIDGEGSSLPRPTQPGFTLRRHVSPNQASHAEIVYGSINLVSLSNISGR